MEVKNKDVIIAVLMVSSFCALMFINKIPMFQQEIVWIARIVLLCCAIYEINTWNKNKKLKTEEINNE